MWSMALLAAVLAICITYPASCAPRHRLVHHCTPKLCYVRRINYDHVEGQLWYWTQEARQLGTLDLRAS